MNAEEVIIECLRRNEYLCSEKLPRNLMIEFGELLNNEPDPSSSPILEFFVIACLPDGDTGNALARNQEYAIDVLLSPKLPNIGKAIRGVFGHGELHIVSYT